MFHTSLAWSPFAELDGRPSKTSESGSTAAGPAASTPPPPPRRAAPQTIGPGPSAQVLPGAKLRPGHGCCPCRRQSESRSQSAPLSAFYVKSWITAEVPRGEWHARAYCESAPKTIGPGPSAQVLPGAKLRPGHGCCPCRRQSESRSQSAPLSAFYVKSWITAEVPRGEWHARAHCDTVTRARAHARMHARARVHTTS